MVGDVIAALGPVVAEVVAEATAPAGARSARAPRFAGVFLLGALGVRRARVAPVAVDVVVHEVAVQEVLGGAAVALELLWSFLVRLFVPLPVGLFAKRFLADGAEIFLRRVRAAGALLAGGARLVVVLFLCGSAGGCASPWRL